MDSISRRAFVERAVIATAVAGGAGKSVRASDAPNRTAIDQVPLGKTGLTIGRLGFGTGSMGGHVYRGLGPEGSSKLVHYALDQGIRFFDTADSYGTHEMLRPILKNVPREELFLQTKIRPEDVTKVPATLDRFRKELGVDYFDSVLIHKAETGDWPDRLKQMREDLSEAKAKQVIGAHGASCHGLKPLAASAECDWMDVSLARINPQGRFVDNIPNEWNQPGDVPAALEHIRSLHAHGKGVIGMKIVGGGSFASPEDRERSIRFVMNLDCVDAVVIGFKSRQEVDEALLRVNRALSA